MDWHDVALCSAGLMGACIAVFHGILVQRLMVRPIKAALLSEGRTSGTILRLVPLLLHLSTLSWLLGGLALVAVAAVGDDNDKLATAVFVGALYLFGAAANAWGTRGRHPGWVLIALAVILIVFGISA